MDHKNILLEQRQYNTNTIEKNFISDDQHIVKKYLATMLFEKDSHEKIGNYDFLALLMYPDADFYNNKEADHEQVEQDRIFNDLSDLSDPEFFSNEMTELRVRKKVKTEKACILSVASRCKKAIKQFCQEELQHIDESRNEYIERFIQTHINLVLEFLKWREEVLLPHKREYSKKYAKKNSKQIKKKNKQYCAKNPAKVKQFRKNFCEKHPESIQAYREKYRKENPQKIIDYAIGYRKKKSAHIKEYHKNYSKKIKEFTSLFFDALIERGMIDDPYFAYRSFKKKYQNMYTDIINYAKKNLKEQIEGYWYCSEVEALKQIIQGFLDQ